MTYLDHAAGTPISENVLRAMMPYFSERFYNPSAPYLPAVEVRRDYEAAKDAMGQCIGGKGAEIVMTAGATESINLAFTVLNQNKKVLVSEIEHASVLEAAKRYGNYELVKVNEQGILDLTDLRVKLTDEVGLVSIGLVNNELGTIQPVDAVAGLVKEERLRRLKAGDTTPVYLHSDASQGMGLLDVNVARLGVDMLTLNAAKIYGPKQVGLLWVKPGVKLSPVVAGGGQELGLRSGTENVAGAVGMAEAMKDSKNHISGERKHLLGLKMALKRKIEADITPARFLGSEKKQLVSFLPVCFAGLDAERLIFKLEEKGVLVSTGAACAANKGAKSHVLRAIGLGDEEIQGSLRISLGKLNNEKDITEAAKLIVEAVEEEWRRLDSVQKREGK